MNIRNTSPVYHLFPYICMCLPRIDEWIEVIYIKDSVPFLVSSRMMAFSNRQPPGSLRKSGIHESTVAEPELTRILQNIKSLGRHPANIFWPDNWRKNCRTEEELQRLYTWIWDKFIPDRRWLGPGSFSEWVSEWIFHALWVLVSKSKSFNSFKLI